MRARIPALFCLATTACSGSSSDGPRSVFFPFPPVEIAANSEEPWLCQSVTLGNDDVMWVNTVSMEAGLGWHHSNWFFVSETMFDGPDGTWNCDDRDFDPIAAGGSSGGGVLFAQSTQVSVETQAFPEGAAFAIPAHSRIVGNIHLLNAGDVLLSTAITLELRTIPASTVLNKLKPMSLTYQPLAIPPQVHSSFGGECDVVATNGSPLDFRLYYVLPHYHGLGRRFWLTASGGPLGDQTIFDRASSIGEPLGSTVGPPIDVNGSTHLSFGCEFDNPGTSVVNFGNGAGEMCMMLGYTDSHARWAGGVLSGNAFVGTDGAGTYVHQGPCQVYKF